mmetsp:Transcript_38240/g.75127  ORF Transcript_38240/g.75127 Transcript_38240/m.75127 type:complete len:245 (-) Transcript_38240:169-903(-)
MGGITNLFDARIRKSSKVPPIFCIALICGLTAAIETAWKSSRMCPVMRSGRTLSLSPSLRSRLFAISGAYSSIFFCIFLYCIVAVIATATASSSCPEKLPSFSFRRIHRTCGLKFAISLTISAFLASLASSGPLNIFFRPPRGSGSLSVGLSSSKGTSRSLRVARPKAGDTPKSPPPTIAAPRRSMPLREGVSLPSSWGKAVVTVREPRGDTIGLLSRNPAVKGNWYARSNAKRVPSGGARLFE